MREALDYGLASAETAFVAVRSEAGKVVEGRVAVANALPAGWSDELPDAGGLRRAGPAPRLAFSRIMSAASPADLDLDDEDPEDDLATRRSRGPR